MNTLIIPCAGKSSRFPNMKPKWMLTHPDGKLMIQKAIEQLPLDIFDRIIITITQSHNNTYDACLILSQALCQYQNLEICILPEFTHSVSETIQLTIEKMNIRGSIVIKDSDNSVKLNLSPQIKNFVAAYDISRHADISNLPGKSFIIINEQNIVQNIMEKNIISNLICVGIYCFQNVETFTTAYYDLMNKKIEGEMYISHIISYLLKFPKIIFECKFAQEYKDWGTFQEWHAIQKKMASYLIDVDGIILKNCGKYGSKNWSNYTEALESNINIIKQLQNEGAQIIITTSRSEDQREKLEKILYSLGIVPHAIVMGMNHSKRIIINDFAPTNPYPSCKAISIPRNGELKDYI